ncbi:MAG: hypothetical protein KDE06_13600, partial [Rhodobacteraceae bacterium]|nr:hypothetical protein [Paracoccaceae bacterium]MCB2152065.1 hypothetical protein [Paracoccaceae bacterium]
SPDAAVDRALDILSLRKIVRREGDRVLVPPKDRALIGFYAAPVRQHLCAPAASNEPEFAEFSPNLRS